MHKDLVETMEKLTEKYGVDNVMNTLMFLIYEYGFDDCARNGSGNLERHNGLDFLRKAKNKEEDI